jgi:SAM-dependent methyltransferase
MTTPRRLVATGYDRIADAYLDRFEHSSVRKKWLRRLIESLPSSGRVLDLGCGAGVPVARELAALGHCVVGVDGSEEQIARARSKVPKATFIHADMCDINLDAGSFDAIGAFYSITHVPSAEQGSLLAKISWWLKPGGALVASLGAGPEGDWTGEWMGTQMFFGHNSRASSFKYLGDAGLIVQTSEVERQDNEDAAFLWVAAVKMPSSIEQRDSAP